MEQSHIGSNYVSYKKALTPLGLWLFFFLIEVYVYSETFLSILAFSISASVLFYAGRGERWLYIVGALLGFVIEVGLGQIGRMQHWENASLLGVPVWLPLVWGIGVVAIRRVGNLVVATAEKG